jgi:putative DNA primase/helicase
VVAVASLFNQGADPADAGISLADIDLGKAGTWQRVPTSDKPKHRNGAVMIFDTRPLHFWFRNHATDVQGVYREPSFEPTKPALAKPSPDVDYAKAAEVARQNWDMAAPASSHPYLERKQVKSHGLRSLGSQLVIPAYDANRHLWTYQTIDEDGQKRFLKGGKKQGCYFPLGGKPQRWLLLVEGYATAASLYECLGLPVAVCFDCGNLLSVSQALRRKLPDVEFVFCADNDGNTPSNPGIAKATKAAAVTGGRVVYPHFKTQDSKSTDWNDYATHYGVTALSECLREMLDV